MCIVMQSAARSKERREMHTLDLEGKVDSLRLELAASQAEAQQLKENVKRLGEICCGCSRSSVASACHSECPASFLF